MPLKTSRLLLLNGPNLNLLGTREPEIYGRATLADIESDLAALAARDGHRLECFQSNAEHALVDRIHQAAGDGVDCAIINPRRVHPHQRGHPRRVSRDRAPVHRDPPLEHSPARAVPPVTPICPTSRRE